MIKQFFCFNFLILVLLENSLQFMIFSIINIINVKIKLKPVIVLKVQYA
jgi:hypothetical protein